MHARGCRVLWFRARRHDAQSTRILVARPSVVAALVAGISTIDAPMRGAAAAAQRRHRALPAACNTTMPSRATGGVQQKDAIARAAGDAGRLCTCERAAGPALHTPESLPPQDEPDASTRLGAAASLRRVRLPGRHIVLWSVHDDVLQQSVPEAALETRAQGGVRRQSGERAIAPGAPVPNLPRQRGHRGLPGNGAQVDHVLRVRAAVLRQLRHRN